MRNAFKTWLDEQPYSRKTRATQWAQTGRIEKYYGDLDVAYDADRFAAIRSEFGYSKHDQRDRRENPARFSIDGDLYSNLASYRASLTYYTRFRESEASPSGSASPPLSLDFESLGRLKQTFLDRYADFASLGFQADHGAYWDDERSYKDQVLQGAKALLTTPDLGQVDVGLAMLDLLERPPSNFVGWRTFARIKEAEAATEVARALGEMLTGDTASDVAGRASRCAARLHPLLAGGKLNNPAYGQVRTLVTTTLALALPNEAIAVKTRYMQRAAKLLTGRTPLKEGVMASAEYGEVLALADAIFAIMRDDWKWAPRDLWDVQGFLWVTSDARETMDDGERKLAARQSMKAIEPTNLILYGPPGTGKTYVTAERAVELCDGALPQGGREALMQRYRELLARNRIVFVTFHQSYAYEDFVEGLRPETEEDHAAEGTSSAGFSLKARPGVFRRLSDLARDNRGPSVIPRIPTKGRHAFKMSLGRSGDEEGTRVFADAIQNGAVMLGWGGEIDWGAGEYDRFEAIKKRWQQDHREATGNDPNVQQLFALRALMRTGDLVIISDGNKKFRAIGEITGPYKYVPEDQHGFPHHRPVRWLWHSSQGLPRELIYRRGFSQVSAYQLDDSQIEWEALDQIIGGSAEGTGATGVPEPHVLIIDEINRANVSKVFGELITLIEPDKRLGAPNELKVTLPYSGEAFGVPANLHIVGTMNTADRSIALLDTALRRRFQFEELLPDPTALGDASEATGVDLASVLVGLNRRIEYLFDRDHQIGHAFFIECRSLADLTRVMRAKIIPLLAEYFYENWEKVRQVLGEKSDEGAFVGRTRLYPPHGADGLFSDEGRWRYRVHPDFPAAAYDQLKT